MRRVARAAPLAIGAALVVVLAGCGSSGPAPHASPLPLTAGADVATLPSCSRGDVPDRLLAPAKLAGPAHGSVSGGRIVHGWSVDGGAVTVSPASSRATPTVPERQAACNLLAGMTPNNVPIAGIAASGSVLGYGRLTVSSTVEHDAFFLPNGRVQPAPPAFRDRSAWILTVAYAAPSSCPLQPAPPPTTSAPALPHSWLYQVYALDAVTGTAAITYVEAHPANCFPKEEAAASTVPYQQLSVPWRIDPVPTPYGLMEITATYADCDSPPNPGGAGVDRGTARVQVVVVRRLGARCAAPTEHPMPLHPATVGAQFPSVLAHAPVGPIDLPDS